MVLLLFAAAPLLVSAMILVSSGRSLLQVPFSRDAFRELNSQVKWLLAVSASGTLMSRMDIFLVSTIGGVAEAGIYSAA